MKLAEIFVCCQRVGDGAHLHTKLLDPLYLSSTSGPVHISAHKRKCTADESVLFQVDNSNNKMKEYVSIFQSPDIVTRMGTCAESFFLVVILRVEESLLTNEKKN